MKFEALYSTAMVSSFELGEIGDTWLVSSFCCHWFPDNDDNADSISLNTYSMQDNLNLNCVFPYVLSHFFICIICKKKTDLFKNLGLHSRWQHCAVLNAPCDLSDSIWAGFTNPPWIVSLQKVFECRKGSQQQYILLTVLYQMCIAPLTEPPTVN